MLHECIFEYEHTHTSFFRAIHVHTFLFRGLGIPSKGEVSQTFQITCISWATPAFYTAHPCRIVSPLHLARIYGHYTSVSIIFTDFVASDMPLR